MKRDLRWPPALLGLLLVSACGSPALMPATSPAVPNAPPGARAAFHTQDRQTYFHLHWGAWVWKDNKWTYYNNPTWWYFVSNSTIYTDLGTGNYYWWYIPHPSNYSGYVYYYTNNRWNAVWRGYDGQ
ncbi:hypothetical protein D3C72_1109970 [compost metagenome]